MQSQILRGTAASQTEVTHLNSELKQLDLFEKWPLFAAWFEYNSAPAGERVRKISQYYCS